MITGRREGRIDKNIEMLNPAIRNVLVRAGAKVAESMQRKLIEGDKVASGKLVRSFVVTPAEVIGGWHKVRVGPTAPHAVSVHFGTPPGDRSASEDIRRWMKLKNIVVTPRGVETPEKAEIRVSFMISRSIERRGIKSFPFMSAGFGFNRGEAIEQLKREAQLMIQTVLSSK